MHIIKNVNFGNAPQTQTQIYEYKRQLQKIKTNKKPYISVAVRIINFERVDIETSFLPDLHHMQVMCKKVIVSGSRSQNHNL